MPKNYIEARNGFRFYTKHTQSQRRDVYKSMDGVVSKYRVHQKLDLTKEELEPLPEEEE